MIFVQQRPPDREYSDQYSQLSKRQWDQSAGLAYLTVNLGGSMQDTLIECVVDSLSEWDLQPRPWDYNREPVLNLNLWTGHGCLNMQSGHIGGFKTGLTEVGSFRIYLSLVPFYYAPPLWSVLSHTETASVQPCSWRQTPTYINSLNSLWICKEMYIMHGFSLGAYFWVNWAEINPQYVCDSVSL